MVQHVRLGHYCMPCHAFNMQAATNPPPTAGLTCIIKPSRQTPELVPWQEILQGDRQLAQQHKQNIFSLQQAWPRSVVVGEHCNNNVSSQQGPGKGS